ncbi:3-methyl-2-oxobutanoate dehydrogenase subunit VorB [Desulforamulus putei]|uniref:2-oxoglutarate ferredoxin oxidoreductase subunit alpha n=1 Tax=Desulforamulus putei DSM 12395 TaxID=1121429 RepID=A0A1M4VU70_9FIRM|nr:3-methyl-2-oxobutanoate dehydrogenase subunit VorB [Desulforamulus putei]SHE72440.1 2-oxoglutarate ferredoxin oxidoreductase subunit alpha [Desulforamulus putei DSM 12395]
MKKYLLKGNEAIAEAAVRAGCRLFFGYPITPSTEIIEYMAKHLPAVNGTFVQAESEVSAINMCFGAAGAGVRVMTASSSPGISLMQEGLSYIAANELPVVVVNIVRAGPGLGGLGPSQADYFQATKGGGHGDYRLIVLAPSTVQELVNLTQDAFDLADLYRNPVMIMADGILGQMMEPVVFQERETRQLPAKDWATTGAEGRPRNTITSYSLQNEIGEANCLRWEAKYRSIAAAEQRWEQYMTDDAAYLMVAYGTTARIAKAAVQMARKEGIKVGLLRPITLWPFPVDGFKSLQGQIKGYLSVELSAGQMIEDVRLATNCSAPVHLCNRQGGMVPAPEEVLERFKEVFPAAAAAV